LLSLERLNEFARCRQSNDKKNTKNVFPSKKENVTENRDQGIGLNGSEKKNGIVVVLIGKELLYR